MKSEPASGASPATGPATESKQEAGSDDGKPRHKSKRGRAGRRGDKKSDKASVEVVLEPQTWRHAGWAAFHLIAGAVLIYGLGSVGKAIGLLLVVLGALRAYKFARAALKPPGRLRVGVDPVQLPRKLNVKSADEVAVGAIQQVFFLRRALPWTQASPVLVVETADVIYSYPRDWFATDGDQRRVARALSEQLGRAVDASLLVDDSGEPHAPDQKNRTQVGVAALVTAIALFVAALVPATQNLFRSFNLPVVVLYIGAAVFFGVGMWHLIGLPDYDDD